VSKKPLFSGLPWKDPGFGSLDHFVVVGDDKIAIRNSKERASLSRQVSISLGFVMSQKDGDSSKLILLCEDHILIVGDETKNLVYVDTIKGRLLTKVNRAHADNRASIFGKGRMLSTQLDYLEGSLRKHVLACHMNLFVREHGRKFLQIRVPWFLPPNAGGLGLEPNEIPEWGFKYINYILSVLDIPDFSIKCKVLWDLRALAQRHQHGVEASKKAREFAVEAIKTLRPFAEGDTFETKDVIFTSKMIFADMEKKGVTKAPWEQFYSFDALIVHAESLGLCQLTKLVERFERVDAFQQMLEKPIKTNRKSVYAWVKKADRVFSRLKLAEEPLDPRYKSLKDLEVKIDRHADGFVSAELISELLRFGPSLRVSLGESPRERKFASRLEAFSKLFSPGRT